MRFNKHYCFRCGLCVGCEREADCGTCKICSNPKSKSRICDLRKCTNRVFHYDLIKTVDKNDVELEQNVNEFEQNLEKYVEHFSSETPSVSMGLDLVGEEMMEPLNSLLCDYPIVTQI